MKVVTLALLSGLLFTAPTFADQAGQRDHFDQNVERHREHLAKELGLSRDQKAQIKRFREQHRAEMQSVKDDPSLTPDQRRMKLMELHRQHEEFLATVLTPAQKAKWMQIRGQHRAN